MKAIFRMAALILVITMLVACGPKAEAPAATEPVAQPEVLTPQQEWLKANQLGEYETGTQDWAAIEEAAKKEGTVLVYANSSKVERLLKPLWNFIPRSTCKHTIWAVMMSS